MTRGVSVIAAKLTPSAIKANPPPDVPTILGAPVNDAPMAMLMAAISSSACSTIIPMLSALPARVTAMEVAGVIG
jgi:hypothetical protein